MKTNGLVLFLGGLTLATAFIWLIFDMPILEPVTVVLGSITFLVEAVKLNENHPRWSMLTGILGVGVLIFGLTRAAGQLEFDPTPIPTQPAPTSPTTAIPMPSSDEPLSNPTKGSTWVRPADNMTMVYVPAGSFLMGSDPDQDRFAQENEFPQHEVALTGFWLDQTEVTNRQFATFVAETGHVTTAEEVGSSSLFDGGAWNITDGVYWNNPQGDARSAQSDYPVVHVSWDDALAYCTWVEGQLPTEAQWEYAARGSDNLIYPWGDEFDGTLLNFCDTNCPDDWRAIDFDDGYAQTAPVGIYPSSASWVGALDMAGNVWEWVSDWYDEDYYASSRRDNPAGALSGDFKVLRGGGWLEPASVVRAAFRVRNSPDGSGGNIGIRCVVPDQGIR